MSSDLPLNNKLRSSRSASNRPLRATCTKKAAHTWHAEAIWTLLLFWPTVARSGRLDAEVDERSLRNTFLFLGTSTSASQSQQWSTGCPGSLKLNNLQTPQQEPTDVVVINSGFRQLPKDSTKKMWQGTLPHKNTKILYAFDQSAFEKPAGIRPFSYFPYRQNRWSPYLTANTVPFSSYYNLWIKK